MVKLPKEVMEILSEPETLKVLTTTGENGNPHSVFKSSLIALDEETLGYLELIEVSRTNKNILLNLWGKKLVSVVLFNPKTGASYQIKAEPYKLVDQGPIWENFLDQVWQVMPDANPASVWLLKPREILNEGYQARLEEIETAYKPSFGLWMKYRGKRE